MIKSRKGSKNLGIDYDILFQEFLRDDTMNLSAFMGKKFGENPKYSRQKTSGWVKKKKEYMKNKLKEKRENLDKDIEDKLQISVNKLMEGKVKIFNILIDRIDDINEKGKKYTGLDTNELIAINNLIKTELGEASEIKKIEGEGGFSISIIPK